MKLTSAAKLYSRKMFPPTWSTSEWVTSTFIAQTITSALQSVLYFTGTTNLIYHILYMQKMQAYAVHTVQYTVSNAKVVNVCLHHKGLF